MAVSGTPRRRPFLRVGLKSVRSGRRSSLLPAKHENRPDGFVSRRQRAVARCD